MTEPNHTNVVNEPNNEENHGNEGHVPKITGSSQQENDDQINDMAVGSELIDYSAHNLDEHRDTSQIAEDRDLRRTGGSSDEQRSVV